MQTLILNASPLMDKGNTALLVSYFAEGLKEAGSEVEIIYTYKLKIKPCNGCFVCWTKTPGKCSIKDDMEYVLPKLSQADILVLATPVYVDGMTSTLKNVLDRSIPLAEPFFIEEDGHCRHPIRDGVKKDGYIVLISNCGYWEEDNFYPLIEHTKAICKNLKRKFAGYIIRPHGPALSAMMRKGFDVTDVLESIKKAAHEVVENGFIKEETINRIKKPLLPKDQYIAATNKFFEKAIKS